jgi:hypothetical protein
MRFLTSAVVVGLAAALAFLPFGVEGQLTRKVHIGFLSPSSLTDPRTRAFVEAFRQG